MKNIFERYGVRRIRRKIHRTYRQRREERNFQKWVKFDNRSKLENRKVIFREIADFVLNPLISIVMPVYNVEEEWLRLAIESVLSQIYQNWEFCIADDFSPSPHIRRVLDEYATKDTRIKIIYRTENGNISAASNSALELASGEFVALFDHDDRLADDALFYVVKEINKFPDSSLIYSDEDFIDENGRRYAPKFKPDWSLDLFYSVNLTTHLVVYRRSVLREIGGFRIGLEGSQDYDLALRVTEQIPENQIRHIPRILYHWRAIAGSVALSGDEKPYAHERARRALRDHFQRIGKRVVVSQTVYNLHRVRYELPPNLPQISLFIIADKDRAFTENGVKKLLAQTDYENLEIVVVINKENHIGDDILASIPKVKTVFCENSSEAEKFNFAVSQTDGEILCFADSNLLPRTTDWLKELASFACQKEIGAVGAKLLYADETILHGGLIIGIKGLPGIAHHHFARNDGGNFVRAQVIGNFSAVSISCLATRREVFRAVGGFDAENLPNKFYDADYCLKLREKQCRIVFTPYAELVQNDANRRLHAQRNSTAAEEKRFMEKWRAVIGSDPFYNPNLSYESEDFSIKI